MKRKITYLILIFLFTMCLYGQVSYAGTQEISNLKYDVTLNEDGSADVTETWDIEVSDTNTLFKNFEIDSAKYKSITNVSVTEITKSGQRQEFTDTKQYAYHVKKGGFYALVTKDEMFEIAWGVSIDGTENKKYEIKYKINDAIKNYNDCSEFYWQFVGKTNGVPARNVEGTIKLPKAVDNIENLRVWAHGPLNGTMHKIDNKTVKFEVERFSDGTMLEVRITTPNEVFVNNKNIVNRDKLQDILSEEQGWADEANRQRNIQKTALLIPWAIIGITVVFLIFKVIKYTRISAKTQKIKPEEEMQYFREIPDETASAAEGAFLYYFDKKLGMETNKSKILSATLLNLALKKAIEFEKTEKNDINIIIKNSSERKPLTEDENEIYKLLTKILQMEKGYDRSQEIVGKITTKDIERFARKHDSIFLSTIDKLGKIAKNTQINKGNYETKQEKNIEKWASNEVLYTIMAIVILSLMAIVFAIESEIIEFNTIVIALKAIGIISVFTLNIVCSVLCRKIKNKMRNLTQKGTNEQAKWKGLKKYMEDFSLLNEREVPELVLWEKYLVYATAFGIADKVISQLKVRYPEFTDEEYMMNSGYTYMYMMNRINLDRMLVTSMNRAYSAGQAARASREYSSGGGRRRRFLSRRPDGGGGRWPEWAEDKMKSFLG